MLKNILKEVLQLKEAKEIKKDSFMYFFLDEIKDIDKINDVEDLGDLSNVEVFLVTDKTYKKDDPGKGEWFKINTEKLLKYIESTVDKYETGDYLDFGGTFTLEHCIKKYIELEFEGKCFTNWVDFAGTMDGSVDNDLNKISEAGYSRNTSFKKQFAVGFDGNVYQLLDRDKPSRTKLADLQNIEFYHDEGEAFGRAEDLQDRMNDQ